MIQKALFGAGCFWGVEEHFRKINGVTETLVGYSGGNTENPTYESVCYDNTDHAEVLLVNFDEEKISYEVLMADFLADNCPRGPTLDFKIDDTSKHTVGESFGDKSHSLRASLWIFWRLSEDFIEDIHVNFLEMNQNHDNSFTPSDRNPIQIQLLHLDIKSYNF